MWSDLNKKKFSQQKTKKTKQTKRKLMGENEMNKQNVQIYIKKKLHQRPQCEKFFTNASKHISGSSRNEKKRLNQHFFNFPRSTKQLRKTKKNTSKISSLLSNK